MPVRNQKKKKKRKSTTNLPKREQLSNRVKN